MRAASPGLARSTEYMSVRMADVPPGRYTLSVRAILEDRTAVSVTRPLDRK